MSRGLGKRQREIVTALSEGEGRGLLPHQVRELIGCDDRPNTRKSIRRLEERALVERDEGGLVKLTHRGTLVARGLKWRAEEDLWLEEQRNRDREWKEFVRTVREAREEELRRYREEGERWEKPTPRYQRYRRPSKNQLRIIAVLVRYGGEDPQRGLPASAVRKLAGIADKSNTTRAIRALTERGTLQRSKDGERLRITRWRSSFLWIIVSGAMEPPLDDVEAQEVLEGFGEWAGVVE